ncbi:MAG TPA: rod shape-determining protein MreC [Candidatus Paceibacterota bacterium]
MSDRTKERNEKLRILSLRIAEFERTGPRGELALILSSISSSPYDTFLVDRGGNHGIAFGSKVITESGVLLGEVIEVYPEISKVELYSAFGKELEVVLDGKERVMVSGQGSQNFFLKLPEGVAVAASSTLFSTGEGAYVLASVEYIKDEPGDAFQKIYARSPVNIHHETRVYVLPN